MTALPLDSWRRVFASIADGPAATEQRLKVFRSAANELAIRAPHGPAKIEAIDALHQLQTAYIPEAVVDDVQIILADAWAEQEDRIGFRETCRLADERKRAQNGGAAPPREEPPKAEELPLPYVDLALNPIPTREWLVPERIPMRNVAMIGGEGAIGKSLLLMQLSGAVVLGREWIGTLPTQGAVLYMSCEEEDDEVRRRMEDVARHLGSTRAEMIERGLRVLSYAGRDAVLAQPDRNGVMRPTPLFERIRRAAMELRPKLIALDTVADIFAGKENDRGQTRQFITIQRGLAIDSDAAVVMAAHPSLTGIATDTGLSGNTGWHNSVRARMYFKPVPGDDPSLRVLEVKKNNYGPVTESILLRWKDGVYVVAEPGAGPLDERSAARVLERLAQEEKVDDLFLILLRRFTKQNRNVSDKVSPTFAPAQFANEPEAKRDKVTKKAFVAAMARLFARDKIAVLTEGPPSRLRSNIVEIEGRPTYYATPSNAPSNHPTNGLPTPTNGLSTHTPHTPHAVGRGKGALEAPAPSNGDGKGREDDEPEMWS
jgi:RecA-family ATPase